MAIQTNFLKVSIYGSSLDLVTNGLRVSQVIDADGLAYVDFVIDGRALGWDYSSTTDLVYLVCDTNGDSVALTRVGDVWRWTVAPDDLRSAGTAPNSTLALTCHIVVERTTGGDPVTNPPGRYDSREFAVTLDRKIGFSPDSISGLVLWLDAYDFAAVSAATAESTWDDKSVYDRDVSQATGANQPTVQFDGTGRPYLLFDGSNDQMATSWNLFTAPNTIFVVAACVAQDATTRGIIQVGGAGGARLAFNATNLKGMSGSDVANTTLPALNTPFVGTVTKAAGGAVKCQYNLVAIVDGGGTQAVTAGVVELADTTADAAANVRIYEVLVYDTVLSPANLAKVQRALLKKWTGA